MGYKEVRLKAAKLFFFFIFTCFHLAGEIPVLKSGQIQGILAVKGEAWIEVKDDKGYTHRYLAPWIGQGPSRGGSFNSQTLEIIKTLVVGNRVSLKWFWDNHLRIEEVELIMPNWKSELYEGYILEIGDKWIDVQNKAEGVPWRFYLPWVGGYPSSGGGYDQSILEPLREHQPTTPIIFEWKYQLRPRIVKLFTREQITTKAFYDVDEIPPWLGPRTTPSKISPFDLLSSSKDSNRTRRGVVNPFDGLTAGTANPFETAQPKAINPFASISSSHVPNSNNPFDSVGGASVNPFAAAATASVNPFDQASNVDSNKVSGEVGDKLKQIILPMVEFKNTPLAEALSQLAKMSVDFDTVKIEAKKGVRIFLETVRDASMPTISLNMKEIKLEDALSRVSEACGWTYEIHSGMIMFSKSESKKVINPFDTPPGKANTPQSLNPFDQADQK